MTKVVILTILIRLKMSVFQIYAMIKSSRMASLTLRSPALIFTAFYPKNSTMELVLE